MHGQSASSTRSPSSRRAWIEILFGGSETTALQVALLAEGVDRNFDCSEAAAQFEVALLAEGVDRNYVSEITPEEITPSPSSRRAWIEIKSAVSCKSLTLRRPPRGGRG